MITVYKKKDFYLRVAAQLASEVTGSGTATNLSPNSRITCPNGSALAGTITFHATSTTGGVVSGTWTIKANQIDLNGPPVGVKSGTFNGGDIIK